MVQGSAKQGLIVALTRMSRDLGRCSELAGRLPPWHCLAFCDVFWEDRGIHSL